MLRAILFDFNGVVLDDEPLHLAALRGVLATEGLAIEDTDYYERLIGLDDRSCLALALEEVGRAAEPALLERLVAAKSALYLDGVRRDGFPAAPGVAQLVEAARDDGVMLGIVSGALRGEIEEALAAMGLDGRFKVIVAAGEADKGKPHPDSYRLGLSRLNSEPPLPERLIHPHEVLAIEDTPIGLEAAAAAGMATLGVAQSLPAEKLVFADSVAAGCAGLSLAGLRELHAESAQR